MRKVVWILVNCNSEKDAQVIGLSLLKRRMIACFDVVERKFSGYFWPPKSGKIEKSFGSLLILTTFENRFEEIVGEVKKIHSDKVPFIGSVAMEEVSADYLKWMENELA